MAMFGKLRKHQKWIWLIGIAVIIPSFVIYFSPDIGSPVGGGSTTDYDLGMIQGERIKVEEYRPLFNVARINYYIRSQGRWPSNDEATQQRLEADTYDRLILERIFKEYDIEVSNTTVARVAQRYLGGADVTRFINEVLGPQKLTETDFANFLRQEACVQQLAMVAGISGKLINPSEAEMLFRGDYENVHVEAATFWTTNYLEQIAVAPEKLGQFYTNRLQAYREPDRIQVSYVKFATSNYLEQADKELAGETNLAERIDEFYLQRGADAYKDTNGVPLTAEAAKEKIRQEYRENLALREAERLANQFGNALLELPQPNKADDLETLAKDRNVPVLTTEPFSRTDTEEATGLPATFRSQAWRLNALNPIQVEPLVDLSGAFVIAFKNEIKGEVPPLEQIQEKVTNEYKQSEARNLGLTAGRNFHATLTNGLAQGKSFAQLCDEAGVTRVDLPAFPARAQAAPELMPTQFNVRMVQQQTSELKPGEVTQFLTARTEGGYILHVKERTPVEPAVMEKELPTYINRMRQEHLAQAFDYWFTKQREEAGLMLPQKTSDTPDQPPSTTPPMPTTTPAPPSTPTVPPAPPPPGS